MIQAEVDATWQVTKVKQCLIMCFCCWKEAAVLKRIVCCESHSAIMLALSLTLLKVVQVGRHRVAFLAQKAQQVQVLSMHAEQQVNTKPSILTEPTL